MERSPGASWGLCPALGREGGLCLAPCLFEDCSELLLGRGAVFH